MPIARDILDKLPAGAAARLEELHAAKEEALGLAAHLSGTRQTAYDRLDRAERAEARLRDHAPASSEMARDLEERAASATADRQRVEADLAAIVARLTDRESRANHLGGLYATAERWVRDLSPGTELIDAPGETAGTLEEARAAVESIRADIHAVESAPIPSGDAKAVARGMVDRLAEAGRPQVVRTVEAGLTPSWPRVAPLYGMIPEGSESATLPLAVLSWLFRDEMAAAFEAEIEALATDDEAIPMADRAARIAALQAKLLAAERDEVTTHHALAGTSDWTLRRGLDARAILLVEVA